METTTGSTAKQDVLVQILDISVPLTIKITSPLQGLFGRSLERAAREELQTLGVTTGTVVIEDYQALDYVLQSRIKAAVLSLRERGGLL